MNMSIKFYTSPKTFIPPKTNFWLRAIFAELPLTNIFLPREAIYAHYHLFFYRAKQRSAVLPKQVVRPPVRL